MDPEFRSRIFTFVIVACALYCLYRFYHDGDPAYNQVLAETGDIIAAKIARNRAVNSWQTGSFILGLGMIPLGVLIMGTFQK